MFKIVAGDFSTAKSHILFTTLLVNYNDKSESIELTGNIESITMLTSERKKSVTGTVVSAAVGAFLLGGVGLLAGGLCGGNSNELMIDVVLKDGRKFCAVVDNSVYKKLLKAERG
jgi:hypothetical protein